VPTNRTEPPFATASDTKRSAWRASPTVFCKSMM
jgi:hypothetical protein